MLAISDGGSTKADWKILLESGEVISATSTGFNPNYDSTERIAGLLKNEVFPLIGKESSGDIYYYGAGCWDAPRKQAVLSAFKQVFPNLEIHIMHDLLAAARASCGTSPGIACILGTGSNSVLYDGNREVDNVTNLGFLLGDEGSGAIIGKELVKSYFYREMPEDLCYVMESICPNGKQDILDKVYGGSVPAAFLASFTKLFSEHKNHPFIQNLIRACFKEFLERHVFKYEGYKALPIHFIGSIAYYFIEILESLLIENGLKMGIVLQKPIDELFKFHLKQLNGASTMASLSAEEIFNNK